MQTDLYRHFDAEGKLLYVGVSLSTVRRLAQHQRSAWYKEIRSVEIEHFSLREEALDAELRAIHEENPIYNIHGKSRGEYAAAHDDDGYRTSFAREFDRLEEKMRPCE